MLAAAAASAKTRARAPSRILMCAKLLRFGGDQHLAVAVRLHRGDHARALHVLDQASGAVVADAQVPLPGGRYSMSPAPSSVSAPDWSRMVRESTFDATWKAMRAGILALMRPVMTSTDGRCVARIRWMPAARAFCAMRATSSSTFFP